MTLSELSRAVGLAPATCHRLVNALAAGDAVVRAIRRPDNPAVAALGARTVAEVSCAMIASSMKSPIAWSG